MMRHLKTSFLGRWWTALAAATRGVRIHPTASVTAPRAQFRAARGAIVSRGCVIRTDGPGTVTLHERVWLARDCEIETDTQVEIGARTTVQRRCTLNGTTRVGEGCIFAPDVFVSSGTHPFREIPHLPIREQERRLAAQGVSLDRPVWIQDDCWIGTHAVVAPGVTIGKGSVVGANSVVTRDVPPYSVVAGIPARVIGQRLAWAPARRVDLALETDRPYVLSMNAPLLVALRTPREGESVRASLRCTRAVRITVNGQPVELTPATTEIIFAPASDLPFGATVGIEAAPTDAVSFSTFELVGE
jgi:acetyltransferase-like isoleucine patch superfamily enzyme